MKNKNIEEESNKIREMDKITKKVMEEVVEVITEEIIVIECSGNESFVVADHNYIKSTVKNGGKEQSELNITQEDQINVIKEGKDNEMIGGLINISKNGQFVATIEELIPSMSHFININDFLTEK